MDVVGMIDDDAPPDSGHDRGGGFASLPPGLDDPPTLVAIPHGGGTGRGIVLGVAIAAATYGLARASAPPSWPDPGRTSVSAIAARIATAHAAFSVERATARIGVRGEGDRDDASFALGLVVDGVHAPLPLVRLVPHAGGGLRAPLEIRTADGDALAAEVSIDAVPGRDGVVVGLSIDPAAPPSRPHAVSLEATFPSAPSPPFVAGVGGVADDADVTGSRVVFDERKRPLGVASGEGDDLEVIVRSPPSRASSLDVAVRTPPIVGGAGPRSASIGVLLGADDADLSRALCAFGSAPPCARVFGRVTGGGPGVGADKSKPGIAARVFGLGEEGAPVVRARVAAGGAFDLEVPSGTSRWYAALEGGDESEASAPLRHEPGWPWELRLNVAAGGELAIRVVDPDTKKPITARVFVRGVDGTIDPNFGPDYRASGAGPLFDALRGEATTPLPAGRYRVMAAKGLEWSVDSRIVDVPAGRRVSLELEPRHVVPTPYEVGCDLHVHARPSFDTPVTTEDRVLSLVAAGIDFAVPTEHNVVGDYAPALELLDLTHEMATVPGVEVTTFQPQFGHFGVFPYPKDERVPPFRGTTIGAIFDAVRRDDDPDRVFQVNHPRLEQALGYFDILQYDPGKPVPSYMRTDFDAIEVYNGYEIEAPGRVDQVLRDFYGILNSGRRIVATGSSDSHRIQYHGAGFPRTVARLPYAVKDGEDVAPLDVVRAIKRGHSTITSGPYIDLEASVGDSRARPGDDVTAPAGTTSIDLHAIVRAAPWIDVTSIEIVADGEVVYERAIPPREPATGPEPGTIDEARARTVRLDDVIRIPWPPVPKEGGSNAGVAKPTAPPKGPRSFVVAVVRGKRRVDEILPFMPFSPLAFTNPIWIAR